MAAREISEPEWWARLEAALLQAARPSERQMTRHFLGEVRMRLPELDFANLAWELGLIACLSQGLDAPPLKGGPLMI